MKKITQKIVLSALFLAALYPACAGAMEQKKKQLGKPSGKTDLQKLCNLLVKKGISAGDVYKHAKGFEEFASALKNDGQYGPTDKSANSDVLANELVTSPNIDELDAQNKKNIAKFILIIRDKTLNESQKIKTLDTMLKTTAIDINSEDSSETEYGECNISKAPLNSASYEGYVEIVQFLIKKGADVNQKTTDGQTALHEAAIAGRLETVKLLIENNANVNSENRWNETVLHHAVSEGYLKIVELLIEHGAEIGPRDSRGYTALHVAAHHTHREKGVEILKLLVQKSNCINTKGNKGETALHILEDVNPYKWSEIDLEKKYVSLKFLVNHGATIDNKAIELAETPELKKYLRDTRFRQNLYKINTNKKLTDIKIK